MRRSIKLFEVLMALVAMCLALAGCDNNGGDEQALPEGALSGVFAVDAFGKTVHFAKGNMYWDGSEYQFDVSQYDTIATWDTSLISHFYWSKTAGVACAETYSDGDKQITDVLFTNATETTPKADFTVNGVTGKYRTLSREEWKYLFNGRENAAALWGAATVCGVHGYVILPDGWSGSGFTEGLGSGWNTNIYADSAAWNVMETAGAVFLPAAGHRDGSFVSNVGVGGDYCSSSPDESSWDDAYYMEFYDYYVSFICRGIRYLGSSVRLVCDEN